MPRPVEDIDKTWISRECAETFIHPDWSRETQLGDLALCILDEAVDILPVKVVAGNDQPTEQSSMFKRAPTMPAIEAS